MLGVLLFLMETYLHWNTSAVTNYGVYVLWCYCFNQDISNWDTSDVTSMQGTFRGLTAFNMKYRFLETLHANVTDMNTKCS